MNHCAPSALKPRQHLALATVWDLGGRQCRERGKFSRVGDGMREKTVRVLISMAQLVASLSREGVKRRTGCQHAGSIYPLPGPRSSILEIDTFQLSHSNLAFSPTTRIATRRYDMCYLVGGLPMAASGAPKVLGHVPRGSATCACLTTPRMDAHTPYEEPPSHAASLPNNHTGGTGRLREGRCVCASLAGLQPRVQSRE